MSGIARCARSALTETFRPWRAASPSSCFTSGDNGDGGPAVGANLGCAYGLGVDAAGELFIGDTYNGRIRMVNTLGIISTIAGPSGNDCSFSEGAPGDGGSALDAILTCPVSVRVDSLGNPYFTDYVWGVVRYINRQSSAVTVNGVTIQPGNIDRLAGNYSLGYSGDGEPALAAEMYYPWDAALDTTGDLYINDSNNDIVRKVDNVGTITTFAGGFNNWGFSGDGGPALDAQLNYPTAIVLDSSHNIFVLDTDNNVIREISGNSVRPSVAFPPVALGSNTVQAVQLYMQPKRNHQRRGGERRFRSHDGPSGAAPGECTARHQRQRARPRQVSRGGAKAAEALEAPGAFLRGASSRRTHCLRGLFRAG